MTPDEVESLQAILDESFYLLERLKIDNLYRSEAKYYIFKFVDLIYNVSILYDFYKRMIPIVKMYYELDYKLQNVQHINLNTNEPLLKQVFYNQQPLTEELRNYFKEQLKGDLFEEILVKELDEYGKNKLASLMEGLLIEIMGKERYEYLLENPKDKANGSYKRSLNTGLGKLDLEVPRVRSGEFRSNLLPPKYQRYDESFEDLIFSFLINGDSKGEIIYKMKLRGLDFSEKAYDEIFEYIKNQFLEFKSKELQEDYYFIYIDAYHCMTKDLKDKRVKKAVVYTVVGIDTMRKNLFLDITLSLDMKINPHGWRFFRI